VVANLLYTNSADIKEKQKLKDYEAETRCAVSMMETTSCAHSDVVLLIRFG